jgi:hypothetical protein
VGDVRIKRKLYELGVSTEGSGIRGSEKSYVTDNCTAHFVDFSWVRSVVRYL